MREGGGIPVDCAQSNFSSFYFILFYFLFYFFLKATVGRPSQG